MTVFITDPTSKRDTTSTILIKHAWEQYDNKEKSRSFCLKAFLIFNTEYRVERSLLYKT